MINNVEKVNLVSYRFVNTLMARTEKVNTALLNAATIIHAVRHTWCLEKNILGKDLLNQDSKWKCEFVAPKNTFFPYYSITSSIFLNTTKTNGHCNAKIESRYIALCCSPLLTLLEIGETSDKVINVGHDERTLFLNTSCTF